MREDERSVSSSLEAMARDLFESLARTFPVACASDEFYYFPQLRLPDPRWSTWDLFSPEVVAEIARRLSLWESELDLLASPELDLDLRVDIALLKKFSRALREQISRVRVWESQPTFYLTLACVGLAEALESGDPTAGRERARSLPAFLDRAGHNLNRVPPLFLEAGLEMVSDTRHYLSFLLKTLPGLKPSLAALDRFEGALRKVSTRGDFLLPPDLLEQVISVHINAGMDLEEVSQELDLEIQEMRQLLDLEAGRVESARSPGASPPTGWPEALNCIPPPEPGEEGFTGLYRDEVERLARHCLETGIATPGLAEGCPVRVAPMPDHLRAIRTASSYSARPGHPPSGGVFYIFGGHVSEDARREYHREYRMLSAHETYPGHHLLDASRWSLAKSHRRVLEQPIFYEGWACLAEDLMRRTGYFSTPEDRLLLARRRLWRAIRGKVDIGLQRGELNIPEAAGHLRETGINPKQALASARKYPLNPGYQLCYTLGLRRFLGLLDRYGGENLQEFTRVVLSQGEIGFRDLETVLENLNN